MWKAGIWIASGRRGEPTSGVVLIWSVLILVLMWGYGVPLGGVRPSHAESYELSILTTHMRSLRGYGAGALGSAHSLNEDGEIIFRGAVKAERGSLEVVTPRSTVKLTGLKSYTKLFSTNDRGEVFFVADNAVVSANTHGALTRILHSGHVIDGKTLLGIIGPRVAANDKGQVAVRATFGEREGRARGGEGLFTLNRLVVKLGSRIEKQYIYMLGDYFVSNGGEVLFAAAPDVRSGYAIFKEDQVLVKRGDMIGEKKLDRINRFGASKKGNVAFLASFNEWDRGIFTLDSLVAQTGDTVDGRTLRNLSYPPLINDNGDVAFIGDFADGSQAIVLAQPTSGGTSNSSKKKMALFNPKPLFMLIIALCIVVFIWTMIRKRKPNVGSGLES